MTARSVVVKLRAEVAEYKKAMGEATAATDATTKATTKAGEAASRASLQVERAAKAQADAAGRVRVAEAQLAQARAKFKAGSAQIVAAEERLAKARRVEAAATAQAAAAQKAYNLAEAAAGLDAVATSAKPSADALRLFGVAALGAVTGTLAFANAASNLEQAVGAADNVFLGYSQAIQDYAADAAQSVGLSATQFIELNNVVTSQLKNLGYGIAEASTASVNLTQRAADLAAQFGGSTTEAMQAFTSALRGETDPIERYGISINMAQVSAKALEMGLWDGKGAVEGFGKAAAVEALILEQSAAAAGQFTKEADTYAGQVARLTAELGNLRTTLGNEVLPAATDVATVLNYLTVQAGELSGAVGDLNGPFGSLPGWVRGGFKEFEYALNPVGRIKDLTSEFADEIRAMPASITPATEAQRQLTKETNDLAYAQGLAAAQAATYAKSQKALVAGTEEFAKSTKDIREILDVYAPGLRKLADAQVFGTSISEEAAEAYENQAKALTDYVDKVRGSISSFADLSAVYDEVTDKGDKAFNADTFIDEQEKRNRVIEKWRDNLEKLAERGLSRSVIHNLESMGVEGGAALVDSLANKTSDKELEKIGKNWTFAESLGARVGREVAVAMVDAMDGKIDGLLNGNPIKIPVDADTKKADKKVKESKAKADATKAQMIVDANANPALVAAYSAVAEINRQRAEITVYTRLSNPAPPALNDYKSGRGPGSATGGAILGPGTATSDSIPAMLSNGEHVLTASDVSKLGGQEGVYRFRALVQSGQIQGFARGGAVNSAERDADRARRKFEAAKRAYSRNKTDDNREDLDEARQDLQDARERLQRVRDLERELKVDIRRREIRDDVTSGIGGAYSTIDRLLDLSRNKDLTRGQRRNLAKAAKDAEPALKKLYTQAEKIETALDKAADKLDELRQVRDQVAGSLSGGFSFSDAVGNARRFDDGPNGSITERIDTKVVIGEAKAYAAKLRTLAARLETLRKLGMPASLLQEIAGLGPDQGIVVADSWIKSGKGDISAIAGAYRDIDKYANATGTVITDALYKGGIAGAKAVVDGLEHEQDRIEKAILKIAKKLETALAKAIRGAASGGTKPKSSAAFAGSYTTASQASVAATARTVASSAQTLSGGGYTYAPTFALDSHVAAQTARGYIVEAETIRRRNEAVMARG